MQKTIIQGKSGKNNSEEDGTKAKIYETQSIYLILEQNIRAKIPDAKRAKAEVNTSIRFGLIFKLNFK